MLSLQRGFTASGDELQQKYDLGTVKTVRGLNLDFIRPISVFILIISVSIYSLKSNEDY